MQIEFSSPNRIEWLQTIVNHTASLTAKKSQDRFVSLCFDKIESPNNIESIHLVTLACFIEFLHKKGYLISISNDESPMGKYLLGVLKFREYWAGKQNYVAAEDESIFNLWRIIDAEKEVHSQRVHDYLKQHFFQHKDLSAVKNSLDEVYYNIFDHAQANGNAFSLIKFDQETQMLYVAVCDFGKGIAKTIRDKFPEITDDAIAIRRAMEDKFTVGSQKHNKGMGLGNILMTCTEDDVLQIISNSGSMYAQRDNIQIKPNTFSFDGTLVFYELSLSHFDDTEIIDSFELDF